MAQEHEHGTKLTGLSAAIKEARQAAGLSQQQLAELLGVDRRTTGEWERTGVVPALRMAKLRQVLPSLGSSGEAAQAANGWTAEPAKASEHIHRFSTSLPLKETPLVMLRRLRRELSRLALELDEALEELERDQP